MNASETSKLIAMLKVHAAHNAHGPELVEMWMLALDDVPMPAAMVAYRYWIRNRKWFPKPMEFREIIEEKVCGLPSVDAAWAQLERSLRENYPGHPVKYTPDPLVLESARTIGGTYALRNAQSGREFETLRERFRIVYAERRQEQAEIVNVAEVYAALSSGETSNLRVLPDRRSS